MNILKTFAALFLLSLFVTIKPCYAGDTLAQKFPAAILVQLRSEHNRIEALKKERMYKEVKEVETDAREVQSRMILDFQINVNYCPVYYFMDTNLYLIEQKTFDGVLMNSDLTPARNIVINKSSDDYLIIYFGRAYSHYHMGSIYTDSARMVNGGEPSGKGLVINDDKYEQLNYIYRLGTADIFLPKKKRTKLFYSSKHYDIEYFPLASQLFHKINAIRNAREKSGKKI